MVLKKQSWTVENLQNSPAFHAWSICDDVFHGLSLLQGQVSHRGEDAEAAQDAGECVHEDDNLNINKLFIYPETF